MTPLPGLVYGTLGFSVVFCLVWMKCFSVGAGIKTNSTQNNNWKNTLVFTAHKEHKYDLICNKANYVRIKMKIIQLEFLQRKENKLNDHDHEKASRKLYTNL